MSPNSEPRTRLTPRKCIGPDTGQIARRCSERLSGRAQIDGHTRRRLVERHARVAVAGDGVVSAGAFKLVEDAVGAGICRSRDRRMRLELP